jgi:hypothetical protein
MHQETPTLPGNKVSPEAAKWGTHPVLTIPSLAELRDSCDPIADNDFRAEKIDFDTDVAELLAMQDDLTTDLSQTAYGKPISEILKILPMPPMAVFNPANTGTCQVGSYAVHNIEKTDVIKTGLELARWFEGETPGLAHRHALNTMLPNMSFTPPNQSLIWLAMEVALYASFNAAWYYKWEHPSTRMVKRPIQHISTIASIYDYEIPNPFDSNGGKGTPKTLPSPHPGTPRHPSYPSGHSTTGAAASEILRLIFSDYITRSSKSLSLENDASVKGAISNVNDAFDNLADNSGLARMWAGIHYRADHDFGLAIGKKVGEIVFDKVKPLVADSVTKALPAQSDRNQFLKVIKNINDILGSPAAVPPHAPAAPYQGIIPLNRTNIRDSNY